MEESTLDREIVSIRTFATPRDIVFKAWSDPTHLSRWWGPKGFTNTFSEFDLKTGGNWVFVMHGPNGVDYPNRSVFTEVIVPERIAYEHISAPKFHVTVTFDDEGEKTRLTFRMLFETAAMCKKIKSIALVGNEQNFDKLDDELKQMR